MKADTANRSAKRTGTRTSMWDNIFKMKHMLNYYYDNKNNASAYLASIIIFDFYISIDARISSKDGFAAPSSLTWKLQKRLIVRV
jgi:hypothetical protein